jgi:hypothetical protein
MTSSCNALRTSQVDINRIYLIFQHFGSFYHDLWIIAANLSNERPIFSAGGEMVLFVCLLRRHHF